MTWMSDPRCCLTARTSGFTTPRIRCWQVLLRMHEDIIPHLANPLMLADLLTGALDSGGLVGMLALHAIFVLVTQHGLEYPDFYARLYELLQPSAFFVSPPQSLLPSQSPLSNNLVVTAYSPETQLGFEPERISSWPEQRVA